MKVSQDREIDSKYLKINTGKVLYTKKYEDWLLVDFDKKDEVVGVEILFASKNPLAFLINTKKEFNYWPIHNIESESENGKQKSEEARIKVPVNGSVFA